MVYETVTAVFQGPLDKLLELIEAKKLDINQLALAEVTAEFLDYLEKLEADPESRTYPQLLAEFLTVASQLLLIKSKALLPQVELSEEEQADIKNLEDRLKLYKDLRGTQHEIKKVWDPTPTMLFREFLKHAAPVFYPPGKLSAGDLHATVSALAEQIKRVVPAAQTVKREVLNMKQKIEELMHRLRKAPLKFSELKKSGASRGELVVLFLAVLHLVRQRFADAEQGERFGDLTVATKTSAE